VLLAFVVAVAVLMTAVVVGVQVMTDTGTGGSTGSRAAGSGSGGPSAHPSVTPSAKEKSAAPSTGIAAPDVSSKDSGSSGGQVPQGADASPKSDDSGGAKGSQGSDDVSNGSESDDRGGENGVPAGFTTYTSDEEGFSILVPEGMKYVHRAQDGGVQLEYKDWVLIVKRRTDATSSALDDWKDLENQAHSGWPVYHRIGDVHSVDYRGWDAADWEWTYNRSPDVKHSLSRGFAVDKDHAYLIRWIMQEDEWDGAKATRARDLSYSSFKVKD